MFDFEVQFEIKKVTSLDVKIDTYKYKKFISGSNFGLPTAIGGVSQQFHLVIVFGSNASDFFFQIRIIDFKFSIVFEAHIEGVHFALPGPVCDGTLFFDEKFWAFI